MAVVRAVVALDACRCRIVKRNGDPLPPCKHVRAYDLAIKKSGLSFEAIGYLLAEILPEEYAEPAERTAPAVALTDEQRELLYAERMASGAKPFHPGDVFEDDRASPGLSRERNGAPYQTGLKIEGGQ